MRNVSAHDLNTANNDTMASPYDAYSKLIAEAPQRDKTPINDLNAPDLDITRPELGCEACRRLALHTPGKKCLDCTEANIWHTNRAKDVRPQRVHRVCQNDFCRKPLPEIQYFYCFACYGRKVEGYSDSDTRFVFNGTKNDQ